MNKALRQFREEVAVHGDDGALNIEPILKRRSETAKRTRSS